MGLDVYLYRYENFDEAVKLEEEYNKRSEEIWSEYPEYKEMTKEQKEEASNRTKNLAKEMGIDEYGGALTKKNIEINSEKYPDHLFKVGYFRSSYNGSGINSVLRDLIGKDLYTIFGANDTDEYRFQVDWIGSLSRTKQAYDKLKKFKEENGNIYVMEATNPFSSVDSNSPKTSKDALKVFLDEKKKDSAFDSYSNSKGTFNFDTPYQLVGIIPGINYLGNPTVYLVCQGDSENLDWYLQSLEIVIETCEYVLAQKDPEKYYLHWSG